MKSCTCCRAPITVPTCRNVRPWVLPFLYALMFECPNCSSTLAAVIWELPDEMLAEVPAVEAA